jgi:hypothetical protein
MQQYPPEGIFQSPYDQYRHRIGDHFIVLKTFTEEDENHDLEVLPMFLIRFDDGVEIEAWPEEIMELPNIEYGIRLPEIE